MPFGLKRIDIGLVLGALLTGGAFAYRAWNLESATGLSQKVGLLSSGTAQLKTWSTPEFREIQKGTELNNLDVLWVGPGRAAQVDFLDGKKLALSEKTLAIIKKPFHMGANTSAGMPFRVLTGKTHSLNFTPDSDVKLEVVAQESRPALDQNGPSQSPQTVPAPDTPGLAAFSPRPASGFPSGATAPSIQVHPAPGGTILLVGKEKAKVPFTWSAPRTGKLLVLENGKPVAEHPLESISQTEVLLNAGGGTRNLSWQLEDQSGSVVLGPFPFMLKRMSAERFEEAMKAARENSAIYVY